MRRSNLSKEALAKGSKHKTTHVLALFDDPSPNPSLRLYLELLSVAGAKLNGAQDDTPLAAVERLKEITRDRGLSMSALARLSGVRRSQLSGLYNDPDPSPMLLMIDRIVTALGAEQELGLVSADAGEADDDVDDAEDADGDAEEADAADDDADEEDADAEEEEDDDDAGDDADDDDADADDDDADDDADDADDDADADDADDAADESDRDAMVAALREQNTALQRRVEANEAQIAELAKPNWWKKLAKGAAGVAAGAGIAILVIKRRKE